MWFLVSLLLACSNPPAAPTLAETAEVGAIETGVPLSETDTAKPAQGRVFFVSPKDGDVVASPVKVVFGVEGMTVAPAGTADPASGHHHLILGGGPIAKGEVVPMDDQHIHFGKGQTETELTLPPGQYALTMQFADGKHISLGPDFSSTVTITVK